MNTVKIKKLALLSYKNNNLDKKRVEQIAKLLKRSELRVYIKYLKSIENSKKITIITPKEINDSKKQMFKKMYSGKIIDFVYDPSLILGIKIIDNDFIYEYNLKDTLNKVSDYIIQ